MTAEEIARRHGGKPLGNGQFMISCPVPTHGAGRGDKRPSLSVSDGLQGLLAHCHAGCSWESVMAALRARGDTSRNAPAPDAIARRLPHHAEVDPVARSKWAARLATRPTVERYLRHARNISCAIPDTIGEGVFQAPNQTPTPSLIAAIHAPHMGIVAVQELRLTITGQKARLERPRLTTGQLYDGAVRLGAPDIVLGISEGIETGLAAMEMHNVPVWASLGAGRLAKVEIPDSVREVIIFADNDDAGRKAAQDAQEKWRLRNRKVRILNPSSAFNDWNDALMSRREVAA